MGLFEASKGTLLSARRTPLGGWATASVILFISFTGQWTVVLRAADTPNPAKSSSQPPSATDAATLSTSPESVQTEETAQLERVMWELINLERESPSHRAETRGRARPLKWDAKLAEIARAHSRDMADRAYVSHFSPGGSFPALRISQAGITCLSAAENVAKFRDIFQAQAAFMNESAPGHNHRTNILDPDYTHVGIGIVRGTDGMLYITQDFVQRP